MIAELRPYPSMTDSGLPWLGKMPLGWSTHRLKSVFREVDQRSGTGNEPLLSLRMREGLVDHHAMGGRAIPPSSLVNYKVTRPGEIVMNRMRAAAGLFAATRTLGLVSPDYAVLRPRTRVDLDYFVKLFRTPLMMAIFRLESRGLGTGESGFLRLYAERFGMLAVPVPPPVEQAAIARFLGHVDRQIRRYVRAKQKLINLLEEQQQAIIRRAVTRGLDVNVQLKPSDVDWLGDVPRHWELRRLKFLARIKTGGRDTVDRKGDGDYPFFVRSQSVERIDSFSFDGEAVLTAGDGAGVAKVFHYVVGKFDFHQRVYKCSNFRHVCGRFFFYYFRCTLRYEAFRETAKSTVDSLRLPMLQNFPVLLPPWDEQLEIVELITRETAAVERSLATVRHEVDLLLEYRSRLIADVVTGKLDVREAAARVPGEAGEPEPPDEVEPLAEGDEAEGAGLDEPAEAADL